jgi:predicted NAD/FAD-binding protein
MNIANKTSTKPRIAVIGSGISGLSAAWLLRNHADITLYEAQSRFGGHTHTYVVEEMSGTIPIDTGFMVFNHENYPNLVNLFGHLGVGTYPTDMSFSVSMNDGQLEYAGSTMDSLFGQRSNLFKPGHWRMLGDITRFNRIALNSLTCMDGSITLGEFLDQHRLSQEFRSNYLYPMAAAIWSCPIDWMQDYPAARFLRFFANHGLLRVTNHLQWYTVADGSRSYLDRMLNDIGNRALAGQPVTSVTRSKHGVQVQSRDACVDYDQVILACHSSESLDLLADATADEKFMLHGIPYQPNRVLLHTDDSLMPHRRRVWSSWNLLADSRHAHQGQPVSVTYWMNSLQDLETDRQYFVSLNPMTEPSPEHLIAEFEYEHPVFKHESLASQNQLKVIQGKNNTWFCGAWTGYGFHEDGLKSGMEVARRLGATIPWEASEAVAAA